MRGQKRSKEKWHVEKEKKHSVIRPIARATIVEWGEVKDIFPTVAAVNADWKLQKELS